jgi:hypothetical protein
LPNPATVERQKAVNQPKQFSEIGKDAKGFYFLCYGPDLLTLRGDLNKALSEVKVPRLIEIRDVHLRQLPCVIVKGKREELEKLKKYLATYERYTERSPGQARPL